MLFRYLISSEEVNLEVLRGAETRRLRKDLRDHLFQNGVVGCRCGDKPIKHRAVLPKDARRGNLVVMDVRSANNLDECVLGPWEKQFLIGLVKARPQQGSKNNHGDDELEIQLYEPYFYDKAKREATTTPLWVALEQGRVESSECSLWPYLLSLPWLPINQLPLSVNKALIESNGLEYKKPDNRNIMENFEGCGVDVVRMGKGGYLEKQKASTIKFVMQLEDSERPSKSSALSVVLNPETQEELMREMLGVLHQ